MDSPSNARFRLKSIEELGFRQSTDAALLTRINPDMLEVQFMTQTILNHKEKVISVKSGVRYLLAPQDDLFELNILLTFEMENIDEVVVVDEEKKKINFKVDIVPTLLNAAMGTLRGILYTKTADTVLRAFPLPLIDLKALMERNTFHVENK